MHASPFPLAAAFALSACVAHTGGVPGDPPARAPQGDCKAALVQAFIGQTISQNIGTQIMVQSGAARLRWGAPDTGMTMDYRPDRVNVFYNENRVTERITCG